MSVSDFPIASHETPSVPTRSPSGRPRPVWTVTVKCQSQPRSTARLIVAHDRTPAPPPVLHGHPTCPSSALPRGPRHSPSLSVTRHSRVPVTPVSTSLPVTPGPRSLPVSPSCSLSAGDGRAGPRDAGRQRPRAFGRGRWVTAAVRRSGRCRAAGPPRAGAHELMDVVFLHEASALSCILIPIQDEGPYRQMTRDERRPPPCGLMRHQRGQAWLTQLSQSRRPGSAEIDSGPCPSDPPSFRVRSPPASVSLAQGCVWCMKPGPSPRRISERDSLPKTGWSADAQL
ncbi:hypothetical protein ABFV05_012490 [Capra hircus]